MENIFLGGMLQVVVELVLHSLIQFTFLIVRDLALE